MCADHVHVDSAEKLIRLFEEAGGKPLETHIEVTADLDFSFHTLPLGAFSNGTCVSFSGVFQGNGHSIKGLKMNNTKNEGYNNSGLFCSLKDATVENLVIDSSCSFIGQSMFLVFWKKGNSGKGVVFLCFGFECAFSTTLTLKNPFSPPFPPAHTVIFLVTNNYVGFCQSAN